MKLVFKETNDIVIVHPVTGDELLNDDGKQLIVTVYGSQSPKYKQAKARALDKSLQRQGKLTNANKITAEAAELLVSCVKSLSGFEGKVDFDQTAPKITMDTLKSVLLEVPWFSDQVDLGIGDLANFQQPNSPTQKNS